VWWDKITTVVDICKLVEFEKTVQPEKDCMTVEEYVEWFSLGLKVVVLRNENGEWKGSYQTIPTGEGDTLFAGFGRHADYEETGIGQIMMNRLISEIKVGALICETRHDNDKMLKLLKTNGFKFERSEYKDGDHWTWWKRM